MGSATRVSLNEYLLHPTEPESEYIDGELVRKPLGTKLHSRLQLHVGALLLNRYEHNGLCQAATEQSLRLDAHTILIPDI